MTGAVVHITITVIFQQSNIAKKSSSLYICCIMFLSDIYFLLERINVETKLWSSVPCLNKTCCFSVCLDASNSIVNMTSTCNGSITTIYKVMATYQIVFVLISKCPSWVMPRCCSLSVFFWLKLEFGSQVVIF